MLRYLIWAFIFYWFFRFVFNFLVPVFRASRQMREHVRQFQGSAGDQNGHGSSSPGAPPPPHQSGKPKTGDYIDFEEVK